MTQNNLGFIEIERTGKVIETLGSARFIVEIDKDLTLTEGINDFLAGMKVNAQICGKMQKKRIKIVRGDKVKLKINIINSIDSMNVKIIFRLD